MFRAEFREKKDWKDEEAIAEQIELALHGLKTMKKYTTLDQEGSNWTVSLEEDPLGYGKYMAQRAQQEEQRDVDGSSPPRPERS